MSGRARSHFTSANNTGGPVRTFLKEQLSLLSYFWVLFCFFVRPPPGILTRPLSEKNVCACRRREEKERREGGGETEDTNNPVMQICAADFEVETRTGILRNLQSFATNGEKKNNEIRKKCEQRAEHEGGAELWVQCKV